MSKKLISLIIPLLSSLFANGQNFTDSNGIGYYITDSYYRKVSVYTCPPEFPDTLTIPDKVVNKGSSYTVVGIASAVFQGSDVKSIILPSTLTSMGDRVFENCKSLGTVIIPEGVTTIGSYAFQNSTISEITIPESVTKIGIGAFRSAKITCMTANCTWPTYNSSSEDPLSACSITKLIIGQNVTRLPNHSGSATYIKKMFFLSSVPPSNYNKFYPVKAYAPTNSFSAIKTMKVYPLLSSWFDVDGTIYVPVNVTQRTCDIIDCNYNSTAENITINPTITHRNITFSIENINPYSYYNNVFIKSTSIDFNKNIADSAFSDCSNMTSLTLSPTVGNIGYQSFSGCKSIETLSLNTCGNIGDQAFLGCSGMTKVSLNNSGSIGNASFKSCSGIRSLTLGTNLTSLDNYSFDGCSNLTTISIPANIPTLPDYVFNNCTRISQVIIEDRENTLTLGNNGAAPIFSYCPLKNVYIGGKIKYTGTSPFAEKTTLSDVTIDDHETTIYSSEFKDCSALSSIILGKNISTIGANAFSGCTALTSLESNNTTPPTCGTNALTDIDKWSCTLHVPASAVTAYQNAKQWQDFFFIDSELSDIEDIEVDRIDNGSIRVENRCIIFDGFDPEAIAEVYTTSGYIIYKGNATQTHQLPQGMYIVKTTNHTFKVAIR